MGFWRSRLGSGGNWLTNTNENPLLPTAYSEEGRLRYRVDITQYNDLMNYCHPILTRSDEPAPLWMEFRDSTRESSPLSTPRLVPDLTPYDVPEVSRTIKNNASIFYGL